MVVNNVCVNRDLLTSRFERLPDHDRLTSAIGLNTLSTKWSLPTHGDALNLNIYSTIVATANRSRRALPHSPALQISVLPLPAVRSSTVNLTASCNNTFLHSRHTVNLNDIAKISQYCGAAGSTPSRLNGGPYIYTLSRCYKYSNAHSESLPF
jgi:hypothetical protein